MEIEIVDDSLYESWEVFSVQISTNTSAVELFNTLIDVYIRPNDSEYILVLPQWALHSAPHGLLCKH